MVMVVHVLERLSVDQRRTPGRAMQRSKLDIGRADAGTGGMSMTLKFGRRVWHGRFLLLV